MTACAITTTGSGDHQIRERPLHRIRQPGAEKRRYSTHERVSEANVLNVVSDFQDMHELDAVLGDRLLSDCEITDAQYSVLGEENLKL